MIEVTLKDINAAAERLEKMGRWGVDDEIGTLNNVSPQDIVNAARLIRKGKVFSLALNFDSNGPAERLWQSLQSHPYHAGDRTDAVAGRRNQSAALRDDMVSMPLHAARNGMRLATFSSAKKCGMGTRSTGRFKWRAKNVSKNKG